MMIKKILAAGALVASTAFLVPQASAQTFSPNGPFTLSGAVTVSKGITLSCTMSGNGQVSSGAATVTSITLSGGLCGSVLFTTTPYPVAGPTSTTIRIRNVRVTAITGSCYGDLEGAYNQATGVITFTNATIPSSPTGGAPCRVTGRVTVSPAITY